MFAWEVSMYLGLDSHVKFFLSTNSASIGSDSLVVHMVKNLPAMQETQVRPLGREDPLSEGIRILAWRISWAEEPGRLQSMGSQRVGLN